MPKKPSISRRSLLIAVPLAGFSSVAAKRAEAASAESAGTCHDKRQPRLKDTKHIRTYYALARH